MSIFYGPFLSVGHCLLFGIYLPKTTQKSQVSVNDFLSKHDNHFLKRKTIAKGSEKQSSQFHLNRSKSNPRLAKQNANRRKREKIERKKFDKDNIERALTKFVESYYTAFLLPARRMDQLNLANKETCFHCD